MDLRDIKAIIDLMKKNSVSEFELEKKDFKIRLRRGQNGSAPTMYYDENAAMALPPPTGATPALANPSASAPAGGKAGGSTDEEIKSPMIGTIYRAPSPESAPYVETGTEVTPETVVCIIEAMKVMNEIKAETSGIISEILVENAKPVEFGQPLFRVKPN